jgi:hypothetical protein
MRRILISAAVLAAVGGATGTAWAEVPSHDRSITKDVTITIPPLAECAAAGAASIDLVFNEQFHVNTTSDTFHLTDTLSGTFTTRDANDNAIATGHFVSVTSLQQPGEPVVATTDIIKATGVTADGSRVNIRLLSHLTITPDGSPVRDFQQVSCG